MIPGWGTKILNAALPKKKKKKKFLELNKNKNTTYQLKKKSIYIKRTKRISPGVWRLWLGWGNLKMRAEFGKPGFSF